MAALAWVLVAVAVIPVAGVAAVLLAPQRK